MGKSLEELLSDAPDNNTIRQSIVKAYEILNNKKYQSVIVSISGGADSDVMLDLCEKVRNKDNLHYIWFDTGLEYQATKEHLKYLEDRYRISILRLKTTKSIPLCNKEYGQPFLSKQVSEFISRLQSHGFQWEDEPFETLIQKYPNCVSALRWWCNSGKDGNTRFNIDRETPYLKRFMLKHPPDFKISNKCCTYAKKKNSKVAEKFFSADLVCLGVRKLENGARSYAYKTCFSAHEDDADRFYPILWYSDKDKEIYDEHYGIKHSACYVTYGLKRTGCAGCPYGRELERELSVIAEYEPKLAKAVENIFPDSYEYTRMYNEFYKEQREIMKEEKRKQKDANKAVDT